jgi:hypothetical protein
MLERDIGKTSIIFGRFLSYLAIHLVTFTPGSQAYQSMFAVQWGLAAVSFVCLNFMPESPFSSSPGARLTMPERLSRNPMAKMQTPKGVLLISESFEALAVESKQLSQL